MRVETPEVEVTAVCHDCRVRHTYRVSVADVSRAMGWWVTKHQGHPIEFTQPQPLYGRTWSRWLREFWSECPIWAPAWYAYGENADHKIAYAASAAYTITLASLASSATFTAGRESTAVANTTNKYLSYLVGGKVTTGTSPTADREIQVWVYAASNDTPTYPDVFDGTDSDETVTSENIRDGSLRLARTARTGNTSDRTYPIAPFSVARLYGSDMPTHHGLFVVHDTAVNLNATGSNHAFSHTGVYGTVA